MKPNETLPPPEPRTGSAVPWPRPVGPAPVPVKTDRELRRFAVTVAAPLAALGAYLLWRGRPAGYVLLGGAALLLLGMAAPRVLAPVERAWMRLAGYLSVGMTYVILTLTYYLVITPFGLLLRLLGKDLLGLRFDRERRSYWEPVESDGPATRPDKPF